MIYLKLFLIFFEIGAVSFGGGYGMVSLIREKVLLNGWLTEAGFLDIIAVSESTPGPLAINMATFVGSSQAGFFGSVCATLGVVLPSFIIILLIAAALKGLMKYAGVQAFLSGVRPCVVALISATAITIGLSSFFSIKTVHDAPKVDFGSLAVFAVIAVFALVFKKIKKKLPSPIFMIVFSAFLGIFVFGVVLK